MDFDWDKYTSLFEKFEFEVQKKLLEDGLKFSQGKLMDLGCGIGRGFPYVPDSVSQLIYVDSSSEMMNLANNFARELKKRRGKGFEFIGRTESIETVVHEGILNHYKPDTVSFFNSLYALENPIDILNKTIDSFKGRPTRLIIGNQGREVNPSLFDLLRKQVSEKDYEDYDTFQEMNFELMTRAPRSYSLAELISICQRPNSTIIHQSDEHFYNSCPLLVTEYNAS